MASQSIVHPHRFDPSRNEDQAIRVQDYLNDKLQETADLASIDSLLEDVKKQQILLKKQLVQAQDTLSNATSASENHKHDLLRRAHIFKAEQGDIDRRLLIVTQSDTSDDAVQKFDSSMGPLRRLDIAQGYLELLTEVEDLTSKARSNFKKSPQEALQPYVRLRNLVNALRAAQPAAEDAAPHLIDHVDQTARSLWKQMKDAFAADFEVTLKKMQWPGENVTLQGPLEPEWVKGVKKLLELQEPELHARDSEEPMQASREDALVLLPLEVMAKPLELRFKYHFEGDRPTNKLDKPEYFLSHVVGLLNTYDQFFAIYLQPILRDYFKKSSLALTSIYIDSTSAFITALLPMLRHKIFAVLPKISTQPQLLSHLIHELMSFDVSLRDGWSYDGGNSVQGWNGLTWEVLVKKDWFGRWLKVEKDFALSRYRDIVDAPESYEIDYDSVDLSATKPTYAAIRVNDLLETITDRYRPLTSFSQKIQFLIDIQITIFDLFHSRLFDSLSKYQASTSSIGRTLQGDTKEVIAELSGLGGIERLCRIYGSAEYLEKKMRDWSDDVFFLELWDELQDRARRSTSASTRLAGPMSVSAVAERTSSTVGSDTDTGALFDETASAYKSLRIRAETVLTDTLTSTFRDTLRPYSRINPWSSLSSNDPAASSSSTSPSSSSSLALTAELDATIHHLNIYLRFLAATLSTASLRRIIRQLALAIQAFLWDSVLMRYTFSAAGIAQFTRDVDAIWETIDRHVGAGQGQAGMRRLKEGLLLLGLPEKRKGGEVVVEEEEGAEVGLWEVEKRVFRSNESAREVLEELGLEVLSEADARHVLERIIGLEG